MSHCPSRMYESPTDDAPSCPDGLVYPGIPRERRKSLSRCKFRRDWDNLWVATAKRTRLSCPIPRRQKGNWSSKSRGIYRRRSRQIYASASQNVNLRWNFSGRKWLRAKLRTKKTLQQNYVEKRSFFFSNADFSDVSQTFRPSHLSDGWFETVRRTNELLKSRKRWSKRQQEALTHNLVQERVKTGPWLAATSRQH